VLISVVVVEGLKRQRRAPRAEAPTRRNAAVDAVSANPLIDVARQQLKVAVVDAKAG